MNDAAKGMLRALVIDDSAYNRQTIASILDSHPEIQVVGRAVDGEEGLKLASMLKPDIITLDLEMPRMDGFTFLRLLMSKNPIPVIVISSNSRKQSIFQALELGAIDFIAKPTRHISPKLQSIRDEVLEKVMLIRMLRKEALERRIASAGSKRKGRRAPDTRVIEGKPRDEFGVIAIGSSTGGPPAVQMILRGMGANTNSAIVVVQHMPEKFTRAFADRLNRFSEIQIREAEDGMFVCPGQAYIAPGGHNLEIVTDRDFAVFRVRAKRPDDRYIPSIDLLFRSAAAVFKERTLGVVLTGMGRDGAEGVKSIKAFKGSTVAESEKTAVIFGMPKEAIETGQVDRVLALSEIMEAIKGFDAKP